VRTNNNGALMWDFTYDVGGHPFTTDDYGIDIQECKQGGGGFIIVGVTQPTSQPCCGSRDIVLLRLNSNGGLMWMKVYAMGNGFEDDGLDVLETQVGDPKKGTHVGDFVVAGWRFHIDNTASPMIARREAYLMRTNDTGRVIWDKAYPLNSNARGSWFNTVDEATVPDGAGKGVGDLIAGGGANYPGLGRGVNDIFVARVDGNNGTFFGPSPYLGVMHGASPDTVAQEIYSLQELKLGTNPGEIVMAGSRYHVLGPTTTPVDMLVVQTSRGLGVLNSKIYADSLGANEQAQWIREVSGTGLTAGNVIVAGTSTFAGGGTSASLLELSSGTLTPAGMGFMRYSGGVFSTTGYSVAPVGSALPGRSSGFIMCGTSTTNSADPLQLYLVKTDSIGVTYCFSVPHPLTETQYLRDSVDVIVPLTPGYTPIPVNPPFDYIQQSTIICFQLPCPTCKQQAPDDNLTGTSLAPDASQGALLMRPNPITRGATFELPVDAFGSEPVEVIVSDMSGAIVHRSRVEKPSGAIPVSTDGWASGTYLVKVTSATASRVGRVVVTDR
jgi:hypothetical protein